MLDRTKSFCSSSSIIFVYKPLKQNNINYLKIDAKISFKNESLKKLKLHKSVSGFPFLVFFK